MKNLHVLPTDKPSRLYYNDTSYKGANSTIAMDWYISSAGYKPYNIYITSDEEIKDGFIGWFICPHGLKKCVGTIVINNEVYLLDYLGNTDRGIWWYKKIILTTDQDLINDGVQAIDDEFLEWFVKNPSCEVVEVINEQYTQNYHKDIWYNRHKIIIPKEESKDVVLGYKTSLDAQMLDKVGLEEPKQETLEEAAEKHSKKMWGVYFNDIHPDVAITKTQGEISIQDFIDGAKWQAERMYSNKEVITLLESLVEHPTKPGYKRKDILKVIEQLKKKS